MADDEKKNDPVPAANKEYSMLESNYRKAVQVVDDIVLKNYLTKLSEMEVVSLDEKELESNIVTNVRLFKITEMVYEKEEFAVYKFASVFNSLATTESTVFLIIDSDGEKTDFYMGIRSVEKTPSHLLKTVKNSIEGQFPGIKTEEILDEERVELAEKLQKNASSISSVSCVASSKARTISENKKFVQGIEKLVLALQREKYTGIIIANAVPQNELKKLRQNYEDIYMAISAFATTQFNYAMSESSSHSTATAEGSSETKGRSATHGTSEHPMIKPLAVAGKLIKKTAVRLYDSAKELVGQEGMPEGNNPLKNDLSEYGKEAWKDISIIKTDSEAENESETKTKTETGTSGSSRGTSQGKILTVHNKSVENILGRIDRQLKRIDECESSGMYECAAYFLSENQHAAKMAAATYKGLMRGEDSGVEITAVNFWGDAGQKTKLIGKYITNFMHPVFTYGLENLDITPGSFVSSNEMAIHMGLPRHSVCGLPVIEHADFAKEVVNYNRNESGKKNILIGKIFNMGIETTNDVRLDIESLSMHTFITGSTGTGKTNTVCGMVQALKDRGIKYLIIEPAKGEYKNFFGAEAQVLGTNPDYTELLKINPFKFPQGIHVLEHVDRLVEIFNVCWPMYAAMPAFLKKALLQAYKASGWDLNKSKNKYSETLFPTFRDLVYELVDIINRSAYSEEVRNNYEGALVTRIESLTDGLFGEIFSAKEIDNNTLFDDNCIVDLSRIGSMETKSLIMGILVMRLNEHRMVSNTKINANLKHITVLEEAHHILKRTSTEQSMEDANMAGKSVEMLTNSIAEMRTYGEGFIIVDQSPNAIDVSAIRNTNTKIIMRLPDEQDRRIAGKAAGLKDIQLDEIIRLPRGVAAVYQNDWVEPVLCKINRYFKANEKEYSYIAGGEKEDITKKFNTKIIEFLLHNEVLDQVDISSEEVIELLDYADIPVKIKIVLRELIDADDSCGILIKKEGSFPQLSAIVTGILEGADATQRAIIEGNGDFDRLTNLLKTYVSEKTDNLPKEFILATIQCLMKNHSENNEEDKIIYAGWCEYLRVKGEF